MATSVPSGPHCTPETNLPADGIATEVPLSTSIRCVDNCEHLLEPVVALVSRITASCPMTTVLVTSREPLGVSGEVVIRIPSLDLMHGRELLERLADRFRRLRSGGRGGLERQQTLRATVQWSYQLLGDNEQTLFARLSVFAGSFDLRGAERVCSDDEIDEFDAAELLGGLVDKSMVVVTRSDGATRYQLLETLRQFAEERLDERGETGSLRDVHAQHFVQLATELHSDWLGPGQVESDRCFGLAWSN